MGNLGLANLNTPVPWPEWSVKTACDQLGPVRIFLDFLCMGSEEEGVLSSAAILSSKNGLSWSFLQPFIQVIWRKRSLVRENKASTQREAKMRRGEKKRRES